ncbi:hypothetical protein DAEQUDRAFT_110891 [Daedalea quercina L-15889]|uniref:DUF6699 domain-containing protein n=1 Tax=Daedalea quercina L-15889 TaxID=1314783 RepID=A0A165S536_9APHY|nr:hypothetical protein DAEQUDRAFT_110891 [Daedalea quercina L-15889]
MAYPYYAGYPYATPYLSPHYITPQVSPLIPPADLAGSPYDPPRRVHFEDDNVIPPPPRRERRPSWYAGMPGTAPPPNPAPFPSPPMLYAALPAMVPMTPMAAMPPPMYPAQPAHFGHYRRRSDSNLPPPEWTAGAANPMYATPWFYGGPSHQLHPFLDGTRHGGPLIAFDMSLHDFRVMPLSATGQPTGTGLTVAELSQPATHPGIKKMTITCDMIPQWPLKIEPEERDRGGFLTIPFLTRDDVPITLGDVLMKIHRHLQQRITQVEWKRLSSAEEVAVSRAYTRRCHTFPSAEALERNQGVRRVDYLLEKYMFAGLVPTGNNQEGFEKVKLVIAPARR